MHTCAQAPKVRSVCPQVGRPSDRCSFCYATCSTRWIPVCDCDCDCVCVRVRVCVRVCVCVCVCVMHVGFIGTTTCLIYSMLHFFSAASAVCRCPRTQRCNLPKAWHNTRTKACRLHLYYDMLCLSNALLHFCGNFTLTGALARKL